MLLVETQLKSTTPAIDATTKYRLRIRTEESDQQLVELPQGKTTIGSSPRCDLRIGQAKVQPLHCLILCDCGSVSVRRWAAGTRLNGEPFDEAPLSPGDRLTVGDVELELEIVGPELAAEKIENPSAEWPDSMAIEQSSNSPADASIDSWGEWHSTQRTELSQERQNDAFPQPSDANIVASGDRPAWLGQWNTPQNEDDQSKGRLTVFREQLSQLEERLSSWKDAREDWQQERAEWRAEREQARDQWCEMERQIAKLQVRANEIVGRIERLEHSMAAQALVPKFDASLIEWRVSEPQNEPVVETPAQIEPILNPIDRLIAPETPPVAVAAEPKRQTDDELAPFAEFSIWRQGAATDAPSDVEPSGVDDSTEPRAELQAPPAAGQIALPVDSGLQITPAKSFFEKYGHMFDDDGLDSEQPAGETSRGSSIDEIGNSDSITRKPQNRERVQPDGDTTSESTGEEEESIEQYMAKLLQRVRGDRPGTTDSQSAAVKSNPSGSEWSSSFQPAATYSAAPAAQPTAATSEHAKAGADGEWLTTSLGTVRRKAPIVEQPADLEALRAVANESARRAISAHGLRMHRRNAITKVIVSTLAGMTSLFMMLAAPHWQDLQFITACVSLIVAAYWAGQTYAELIDAFRAATYDGPEDQLQGFASPMPAVSPVDAEDSAKS
jgi:hypothetical protein